MFCYIIFVIYNIIAWFTSFMLLGSTESTQPFKNSRGNLYLDYYPILYSKGQTLITNEYSRQNDWVETRGINQQMVQNKKSIPIVTSQTSNAPSLPSSNNSKRLHTFTTINSELKSRLEDGISMGSKISENKTNPKKNTNLKKYSQGKEIFY